MLPLYLLGNLHCMGMCGPLVMMLGQNQYRYYYFLGRLTSYSLVGLIAGQLGAVLNLFLAQYHLTALISFLFGGFILLTSIALIGKFHFPGYQWFAYKTQRLNNSLSILMLQDRAWPSFLFGFFTVFLPCGQTLIVFSACALSGSAFIGFINGFVFSLLTSPSLFLAMHMRSLLKTMKQYYNIIMGCCAMIVGILACLRGFAEIDLINHFVLNPHSPVQYHIVIY